MTFEVPIFDFGETRVREAEQTYMQAVNRLAEKAVNARSEAREAYTAYRSSYDIASRYRRDVLPLRKTISDEMMLRYGAMQIDVFSLLNDARQRIAASIADAEARRDFWIASVNLSAAITGSSAAAPKRKARRCRLPTTPTATEFDEESHHDLTTRSYRHIGHAPGRGRRKRTRAGCRHSRGDHLHVAGHAATACSIERA